MTNVADLYKKSSAIPLVGDRLFSLAFAQKAPYFWSIRPRFTVIEANHAELVIPKRRAVQNHIGTVHAIALCNGLEAAMGALAEATIPAHLRWIPKGMELEYLAMADSTLVATADTDPADWAAPGEVDVRVQATREDGTVVVRGVIRLYVSERKRAEVSEAAG
jgi:hypothetical protein